MKKSNNIASLQYHCTKTWLKKKEFLSFSKYYWYDTHCLRRLAYLVKTKFMQTSQETLRDIIKQNYFLFVRIFEKFQCYRLALIAAKCAWEGGLMRLGSLLTWAAWAWTKYVILI
jgi:hypothetical protein